MVGQAVSLGIGSPASIPLFLLVGLSPNASVLDAEAVVISVSAQDRTILIPADHRTVAIPADDRTILIPDTRG